MNTITKIDKVVFINEQINQMDIASFRIFVRNTYGYSHMVNDLCSILAAKLNLFMDGSCTAIVNNYNLSIMIPHTITKEQYLSIILQSIMEVYTYHSDKILFEINYNKNLDLKTKNKYKKILYSIITSYEYYNMIVSIIDNYPNIHIVMI